MANPIDTDGSFDIISPRLKLRANMVGVPLDHADVDNNFEILRVKLNEIIAESVSNPSEQNVQANWEESDTGGDAFIRNKPVLATVSVTGSYNDLTETPALSLVALTGDWQHLTVPPPIDTIQADIINLQQAVGTQTTSVGDIAGNITNISSILQDLLIVTNQTLATQEDVDNGLATSVGQVIVDPTQLIGGETPQQAAITDLTGDISDLQTSINSIVSAFDELDLATQEDVDNGLATSVGQVLTTSTSTTPSSAGGVIGNGVEFDPVDVINERGVAEGPTARYLKVTVWMKPQIRYSPWHMSAYSGVNPGDNYSGGISLPTSYDNILPENAKYGVFSVNEYWTGVGGYSGAPSTLVYYYFKPENLIRTPTLQWQSSQGAHALDRFGEKPSGYKSDNGDLEPQVGFLVAGGYSIRPATQIIVPVDESTKTCNILVYQPNPEPFRIQLTGWL
jgi:hypothetical protein